MNDSDDDGPFAAPAIGSHARLVVGIGCTSRATAAEIIALIDRSLGDIRATGTDLIALVSHVRKLGSPILPRVAKHFGVELRLLETAGLAGDVPRPSTRVERLVGLASVAEAAAAAVGPLVVGKSKSAHATCAIAMCADGFDLAGFGGVGYPAKAATASSSVVTSRAGP